MGCNAQLDQLIQVLWLIVELMLWRNKDLCRFSQLYSGDPENEADAEGNIVH